jgi:polysaccharide biosynthesis protein PslG
VARLTHTGPMRRSRSLLLVVVAVVALAAVVVVASLRSSDGPEATASPSPGGAGSPAGSAWQPGEPSLEPPARVPGILGVNYHPLWEGSGSDERARVLDEVAASRVPWVRLDIGWHDVQPDGPDSYDPAGVRKVDQSIREARQRGLKVLLLFYWAPEWASGTTKKNGRPRDPAQYAAAAAWVADRYSGRLGSDLTVGAIELWNEPDLDRFWAPEPAATRVSDFATLVRLAGAAVKQVNPEMTVVTGGLSLLDTAWLQQFYAAGPGAGSSYDVLGLHAYPSPSDSPPDHFDVNEPQYSMLTLAAMAQVMDAAHDPASIWVTEFGWSTHPNNVFTQPWERGVTEQQQADYLLASMRVLGAQPRVAAAFWYDAWSPPVDDENLAGFGLLSPSLRRKPAFFAMRCVASEVCGPS